ncbi:MAG: hypothetical protein ACOYUZ_04710 [Patescibacteria group bacterium]
MKRFRHTLIATGIGVMVFIGEFGCVLAGEPFDYALPDEAEPENQSAVSGPGRSEFYSDRYPIGSKRLDPAYSASGMKAPPKNSEPNSIILETCEPDPDEVAVLLNPADGKECHKVRAQAILAESHGISYVEADFTWKIADPSIVRIKHNSNPLGSSVELEALSDIFSQEDLTQEPSTNLEVCAIPKGGWKDKNHSGLCRSIPVRAVANMEGSWCFECPQLTPDPGAGCHALTIEQDGRFLTVEIDDQGSIYEKQLVFYYDNLEYRTKQTSSYEMSGMILANEDIEGSFYAFRLPLY